MSVAADGYIEVRREAASALQCVGDVMALRGEGAMNKYDL